MARQRSSPMREELQTFKRGLIVEAAARLFYERGFVGTTLDAIADELSMTKPFLYHYFDSKHAILAAVVEREIRRVIELLDEVCAAESSPAARLRRFAAAWARENIEFQKINVIFNEERRHFPEHTRSDSRRWQKKLNDRLTELIRAGDEAGVFDSGNPRIAAFAITGAMQWIPRWYRADGDLRPEEIGECLGRYALRLVNCRQLD